MTLADTPEKIAKKAAPVLAAGVEVGLRLAVMVRPTRAEARDAAMALVAGLESDRVEKQTEAQFCQRQ